MHPRAKDPNHLHHQNRGPRLGKKNNSGFSVWGVQNTCTPLKFNPKQFSESVFQTSAIFKHVSKVFVACVRKKLQLFFGCRWGMFLQKLTQVKKPSSRAPKHQIPG